MYIGRGDIPIGRLEESFFLKKKGKEKKEGPREAIIIEFHRNNLPTPPPIASPTPGPPPVADGLPPPTAPR